MIGLYEKIAGYIKRLIVEEIESIDHFYRQYA
jgi:hypothetical protein